MPFVKGTPKPPNSGRKKGQENKATTATKNALQEAFEELGGVSSLVSWAIENQTEFYRLWGKSLPREITGKDGGEIGHVVRVVIERDEYFFGGKSSTPDPEAAPDTDPVEQGTI